MGTSSSGSQYNGNRTHARFFIGCKRTEVNPPNPFNGTMSYGYVRQPGESDVSLCPIPQGATGMEFMFTETSLEGLTPQIVIQLRNELCTAVPYEFGWIDANQKITIDLTQYPTAYWFNYNCRFSNNAIVVNYLGDGFYAKASDALGLKVKFI